MRLTLGPLSVKIKYTYIRGQTTIYQRAVPTDLRDRYPSATIKHVLKTTDPIQVARLVAELNCKLEAEWDGLRTSPDASPRSLKAHADAFLKRWGLTPNSPSNDPQAIELLHDYFDEKRGRYAGGDDEVYRDAEPPEYLTSVESEAWRRLHGSKAPTLTDALEEYLRIHPKRDNAKFVTYQRRTFDTLVAVCGDMEIDAFKKADARAYVEAALQSVKTKTIRRRLGVFLSVFASYIREHDLTRPNPFARIAIPQEGHDSNRRASFTATELSKLESACRSADDPMRWILAMLAGTGARLAEVVGLLLEDIKLDAPVPYIHLQVHPWRDIKGANGLRGVKDRTVPLAGVALWAAQRVVETAAKDQRFAFPQYTSADECKGSAASAALNSWVRRQGLEHTCHELRHTMKDLLRDVQCPHDISHEITGHGKRDTGDGYGSGYSLHIKAEWLARALNNAKSKAS